LIAAVLNTQTMNRRSFLKVTAVAAATTAYIPRTWAAPSNRNLRKAIMYSTIGMKVSVLEKFRAMKEAGFEGLEPLGGMNRDEVLAALKATGLQAASVCCHTHWEKPLSSPDEATRQIGLEGLLLSLRDAHAYGATWVLLVPGVARNGVSYQQCFEHSIAEIKKAIPIAQEMGVKIAIENVGNNFITSPEQAVEYLDAIHSEWMGWYFDIDKAGRVGPAERWIQVIGKRIFRIHIKDYSAKPRARPPKGAHAPNYSLVTPTGLR
jgi:hexulose-6-phosphate isomerase